MGFWEACILGMGFGFGLGIVALIVMILGSAGQTISQRNKLKSAQAANRNLDAAKAVGRIEGYGEAVEEIAKSLAQRGVNISDDELLRLRRKGQSGKVH